MKNYKRKAKVFMRPEERSIRLFRRLTVAFGAVAVVFGLLAGWLVWWNWDYLAFKFLVGGNYVFTDTLDGVWLDALGVNPDGKYFKNFDDVAIWATTEKIRQKNDDRYTYLYTPPQYELSRETTKEVAMVQRDLREMNADTVYLRLPNISQYTRDYIYDNKALLKGYSNIIIDLRGNPGGGLKEIYSICDLFVPRGGVIAYEEARLGLFTKTVKSSKSAYFSFDNIVFLQDGQTASAAEIFITAVKANADNVTVIGQQSFGKGIGQTTLEIKGGYAVKATTLLLKTPTGGSIHKKGITPDISFGDEDGDIVDFAVGNIGAAH